MAQDNKTQENKGSKSVKQLAQDQRELEKKQIPGKVKEQIKHVLKNK